MLSSAAASLIRVNRAQRDQAFEQWLATVHRVCGEFDAQPLGEQFVGSLRDLSIGNLRMSLAEGDGLSLSKRRQHIRQGHERYFYTVLQLDGASALEQEQSSVRLVAGDIALLDGARPFDVHMLTQSRQISLLLPASLLESDGVVSCAQRIDGHSGLGHLARRLVLDAINDPQRMLGALEAEAMLAALVSLLKPIARVQDAEGDTYDKTYRRACAYIDEHLRDEALAPERIAQAVGVSVRGLYRVFARRSQVIARHIRDQRLERCAQDLRGAAGRHASLTSLALEWGFTDASHFSSAFKARYGLSPSEYRRNLHNA